MSNSDKQKLVFLLGSGISIPAGMPSMAEITKKVLCGFVEPTKKRLEGEQKEDVQRIFIHFSICCQFIFE
jgi:hypothetical protein